MCVHAHITLLALSTHACKRKGVVRRSLAHSKGAVRTGHACSKVDAGQLEQWNACRADACRAAGTHSPSSLDSPVIQ